MKRWVAGVFVGALLVGACDSTPIAPSSTTPSPTSPPTTSTTVAASAPQSSFDARSLVAAYFRTDPDDRADRDRIADEVTPLVDVSGLSNLLHESMVFEAMEPGRSTIAAPIGFNQSRQIVVRTPEGYTPSEPWPLIVLYHGWGGEADLRLDRFENQMGEAIDNYVVAAPDDYRQTVIDAPPPVSSEHVSMWREIREQWHIDADRMYLTGYSLGGDTVLTLATMHPGHVAGGLAQAAGASYPTDADGLLERFLPQLARIPILHVYGSEDNSNIPGLNGRAQDITLVQQAERIADLTADLELVNYRVMRLDGVGHSGVYPTVEESNAAFTATRPDLPLSFAHSFRYIHQADAYWVEGHEWDGEGWITPWPDVEALPDEDEETALMRTIHELLGRIDAWIDGQSIAVTTTGLADLTVWLHDGTIDWAEPVTVTVNDQLVFEGVVSPSVDVALAQAYRTRDFDRLRLAGIRVDTATGGAHVVDGDETFPDIVRGVTLGSP